MTQFNPKSPVTRAPLVGLSLLVLTLSAAACDDTAKAVRNEAAEEKQELERVGKNARKQAERKLQEAKREAKQAKAELEAKAAEAKHDIEKAVDEADQALADEIRRED